MEGIYTEVQVKKQYKHAELQFQLEEDINLPEMKPDLETVIAQKWNVLINDVKNGNGKVCVEGEVEYLILYSREDSVGRLEVLNGTFPFQQCLVMDTGTGEMVRTKVNVTSEQVKKRNSRKLSVLLTVEMEAAEEGPDICRFMEDWPEHIEKKMGHLEVMSLVHMGKESIQVKELVSLPANRPDVGRLLMEHIQLRSGDVYLEDGKFILRGELFVFACYESGEENPRIQFLDITVPFEREADCGFCRDELILDYDCNLIRSGITVQTNEDGEERDFAISAEVEIVYELKEKRECDYLQDAYSLEEEIRPLWQETELERENVCNARRIRVSEVFVAPFDEKMLQAYPMRGRLFFSEPEITEGGVVVEGTLQAEIIYLTANSADPPVIGKVNLPFHQQFELGVVAGKPRVKVRGNISQLTVNIIDSGQAEVKGSINLTVCICQMQKIPFVTKVEKMPRVYKEERMAGIIGCIVQKEDSLWSLAKENKTTVGDICKINNITNGELPEGEKIIICRNM